MKSDEIIISHIDKYGHVQSNTDHQKGVAKLASCFADSFGLGECGLIMGLLHDKGKEQTEWQEYIRSVTGYKDAFKAIKKRPPHAYVGAAIAQKYYPYIAPLITNPIAGHHRGLYDYKDYEEEAKKGIPGDVSLEDPVRYTLPKLSEVEKYDHSILNIYT